MIDVTKNARTLRIAPGTTRRVQVISDRAVEWQKHWQPSGSVICARRRCPLCTHEAAQAMTGVFVRLPKSNEPRWLELTTDTWLSGFECTEDIGAGDIVSINARPLAWTLDRLGHSPYAPTAIDAIEAVRMLARLHRLPGPDPMLTVTEALREIEIASRRRMESKS